MNEPSIFTKIVNGDIPRYTVYEDELTLAFLDIYAVVPGHTLVIPKRQIEFVWDLPQQDYEALCATAQKVALRLRSELSVPYLGQKIIGTDVPHAHMHLIPFSDPDTMQRANAENAEPDHAALAAMAERLFFV